MYHFLEESAYTKFLGINDLSMDAFKKQVKYFKKQYTIITMEDLIDALQLNKDLPKKAMLLTFDDGLNEHFRIAFPILKDLNVQGSFFLPMSILKNRQLLNIHKLQSILAHSDIQQLISQIYKILDELRPAYKLKENKEYYNELAFPGRFDIADVNFIKLLLQRILPKEVKKIIINRLFDQYCKDININNFYLNFDQIKYMKDHGMYIGNHGFNHNWLDILNKNEQEIDMDLSLRYLRSINKNMTDWVIAYPFGAYNNSLINIIKQRGCVAGFTTSPNVADIKDNKFVLPRIDIHYFKKNMY